MKVFKKILILFLLLLAGFLIVAATLAWTGWRAEDAAKKIQAEHAKSDSIIDVMDRAEAWKWGSSIRKCGSDPLDGAKLRMNRPEVVRLVEKKEMEDDCLWSTLFINIGLTRIFIDVEFDKSGKIISMKRNKAPW